MLSNTYRESSLSDPAAAAIDPDNKLLWHYPRHRAEAEMVRDAMLFTADRLNLEMGGPGVRPELPEGVDTSGYNSSPSCTRVWIDSERDMHLRLTTESQHLPPGC